MTLARDAELSALLDGALSAHDATALRAEIERTPALASRLAELARVDEELRALPARPVPRDLRARLQAKLDADARVRPPLGAPRRGAPARAGRQRAWIAGFAAAAAAAIVAVIALPGRDGGTPPSERVAVSPALVAKPASENPGDSRVAADFAAVTDESEPFHAQPAPPVEIAREPLATTPKTPGEAGPARSDEIVVATAGRGAFEPEVPALEISAGPAPSLATVSGPAILVEVSDEESEALDELELGDTSVVAVLDLLNELDALEAGAS